MSCNLLPTDPSGSSSKYPPDLGQDFSQGMMAVAGHGELPWLMHDINCASVQYETLLRASPPRFLPHHKERYILLSCYHIRSWSIRVLFPSSSITPSPLLRFPSSHPSYWDASFNLKSSPALFALALTFTWPRVEY